MKKIYTALFLIISISSLTYADDAGISIECTIGKVNYVFFNQLLSCTVKSQPNIMKKDVQVTSICSGSTDGIKVFYAISKVIRYIPKNLEVVFPDLTGFRLESTQLKMVTKEDLQPFTELLMFASVSNHIEFLEEDLFMYNTKLQYVSFRANKISFIHPSVFAVISGTLKQLYMDAQAINCGIGNPTTATAIENALTKFASSICVDITNAPPLYTLWLELKAKVSGGSEELDTCNNEKDEATAELDAVKRELIATKSDLERVQAESDACRAELDSANGACEGTEATLDDISQRLAACCLGDASPTNCPGL